MERVSVVGKNSPFNLDLGDFLKSFPLYQFKDKTCSLRKFIEMLGEVYDYNDFTFTNTIIVDVELLTTRQTNCKSIMNYILQRSRFIRDDYRVYFN